MAFEQALGEATAGIVGWTLVAGSEHEAKQ